MYAKKGANVKIVAALLAIVLLIGCGIGGTIAYLMTKTDPVVNTFTTGDVEITLKESPIVYADDGKVSYSEPASNVSNAYKLIPGTAYKKDPVVAVTKGSEDCYLFVKIEEDEVNETYLTYELKLDGWTKVDGEENVWYREVKKTADTDGRTFNLLKDDKITINTDVTKSNMTEAAGAKLTFTAYAVQSANLSVAEAWAQAKTLS